MRYRVDYNNKTSIDNFIAMYERGSCVQLMEYVDKWADMLKIPVNKLYALETVEDYNDPFGAIDMAIVFAHLEQVAEMEEFPELFAQLFGEE